MSDFTETQNDLNPPSYQLSKSCATYKIPPILQLHIKRTWITGLAIDPVSLAKEITQLDPRVETNEVLRFLTAHIETEEWREAREQSLNRSYSAMLKDAESIKEHIDQRYDKHFQNIQQLCAEQIDRYASVSAASQVPLGPKQVQSLKNITLMLKETYLMQRLARGLSQGKYTHEVIKENAEFEEALTLLKARLDEKIIEAQVKILPSV